jgi:small subunit ribosomal protein S2
MASSLIQQLLDAGVHFGHQTRRWHPKMRPYLFGSRSGIHIIDLEKTERLLQEACTFLGGLSARNAVVLFVGTKKQARGLVKEAAERVGMPYVNSRWLGGTLTNYSTIRQNLNRLNKLRQQKQEGFFERVSKRDAKQLSRQLERLEDSFSGLSSLEGLPGCLFVVDTKREQNAVREAKRLNIPVVAICDSNVDPTTIDYPIPGNDDAIRSIRLILAEACKAIEAGRSRVAIQPLASSKQDEPVELSEQKTESISQ